MTDLSHSHSHSMSLIDSLTHSFTHSLGQSVSQSVSQSVTHSLSFSISLSLSFSLSLTLSFNVTHTHTHTHTLSLSLSLFHSIPPFSSDISLFLHLYFISVYSCISLSLYLTICPSFHPSFDANREIFYHRSLSDKRLSSATNGRSSLTKTVNIKSFSVRFLSASVTDVDEVSLNNFSQLIN